MTIEEKAKEYLMNFPTNSTFSIEEMIINAFIAGYKCCENEKCNSVNLHLETSEQS